MYDFGDGPFYVLSKGPYEATVAIFAPGDYDAFVATDAGIVYSYSGSDLTGFYNFLMTH